MRYLRPGETPDPDDWNELVSLLDSLLRPAGAGDVEVSYSREGLSVNDHRPKGHWARITHDTAPDANRYAHVPIRVTDDTGAVDDEPDTDDRPDGEPDYLPAVEMGGREDVPDGAVVWLEPSAWNSWYEFSYPTVTLYVRVLSKTSDGPPRKYTVRPVQRNAGNTAWEDISGAADITDVVEDQDRAIRLVSGEKLGGGGSLIVQAYELHTDATGRRWIEIDQDADGSGALSSDPLTRSWYAGYVAAGEKVGGVYPWQEWIGRKSITSDSFLLIDHEGDYTTPADTPHARHLFGQTVGSNASLLGYASDGRGATASYGAEAAVGTLASLSVSVDSYGVVKTMTAYAGMSIAASIFANPTATSLIALSQGGQVFNLVGSSLDPAVWATPHLISNSYWAALFTGGSWKLYEGIGTAGPVTIPIPLTTTATVDGVPNVLILSEMYYAIFVLGLLVYFGTNPNPPLGIDLIPRPDPGPRGFAPDDFDEQYEDELFGAAARGAAQRYGFTNVPGEG